MQVLQQYISWEYFFFPANLVPKRNYTLNSVMFASKTKILYRLFDQGRRFSFKLIENILQVVIEVVSNNYSGQTRSKQLKPTVNTSYVEIWRRQTVRLLYGDGCICNSKKGLEVQFFIIEKHIIIYIKINYTSFIFRLNKQQNQWPC